MHVRPYEPGDEAAICAIYNHYIERTTITFEIDALSREQMRARIEAYVQAYPFYVCELEGTVRGYCYATQFRPRAAFRHTVEASVYVDANVCGRGVGRAMYATLMSELETRDVRTVVGVVALPNEASERLHDAFGFSRVGQLREVGRKLGQWIDIAYFQKMLK